MKISYRPLGSLLRPWRVEAPWAYEHIEVARDWGMAKDRYHRINLAAFEWLFGLPDHGLMGLRWRAVKVVRMRGPLPFRFTANKGVITLGPPPPAMWFARRSDALMFKLAMGGK